MESIFFSSCIFFAQPALCLSRRSSVSSQSVSFVSFPDRDRTKIEQIFFQNVYYMQRDRFDKSVTNLFIVVRHLLLLRRRRCRRHPMNQFLNGKKPGVIRGNSINCGCLIYHMRPINYDLYTTYTQHTVLLYEAFIVEIVVQFSVFSLPVFQKKNIPITLKSWNLFQNVTWNRWRFFFFSSRILLSSRLSPQFSFLDVLWAHYCDRNCHECRHIHERCEEQERNDENRKNRRCLRLVRMKYDWPRTNYLKSSWWNVEKSRRATTTRRQTGKARNRWHE